LFESDKQLPELSRSEDPTDIDPRMDPKPFPYLWKWAVLRIFINNVSSNVINRCTNVVNMGLEAFIASTADSWPQSLSRSRPTLVPCGPAVRAAVAASPPILAIHS
jgi:hypothetical protein